MVSVNPYTFFSLEAIPTGIAVEDEPPPSRLPIEIDNCKYEAPYMWLFGTAVNHLTKEELQGLVIYLAKKVYRQ